uniref:BPTI/Kunitz inhibitor domain-containing protein n=1 Tax=Setaria digitata TaxID=48799 RepID=A0A915Q219_9BILA
MISLDNFTEVTHVPIEEAQNEHFQTYDNNSVIKDRLKRQRSILVPQQFSFSFNPASQVGGARACNLPQQIGTGPYRIPRWYYNSARMRCELFYWSGCCANGNNFPSIHNCQRLCEVDPCKQDLDEGDGTFLQPRYYFNKYAKVCEQFNYRGNGGNRNNFDTLQECQQRCPETLSPCAYGSSMPQILCLDNSMCNVNQFCHIGQSQQTTVCCNRSPSGDHCSQVLNAGLGDAYLQRWHFNDNTETCEPFIYRGLQGNENNFLSRTDCESTCFLNPCAAGEPYRIQGSIIRCSPAKESVCSSGHYCHIGAELRTTVCCPNLGGNACEQQVDRGQGNYQLQRWYWNVASQQCMPFVYGGLKGTQNNFLNQEICEKTCYVFENPCVSGKPQQGLNNRPLSCSSSYNSCSRSYWCHIGAVPQTTVCCPGRVDGAEICKLPLSIGSGNANLKRWYFNQKIHNCIPFSYGGMYGNQNNFLTQQQCQQVCPGFINPCASGKPEMDKNGHVIMCSTSINSCSSTSWCHIGALPQTTLCCEGRLEQSAVCQLSHSLGDGGANLQRWYFNSNTHQCIPFIYGGLYGNQNNFLTEKQCAEACPAFVNPCASGNPQLGQDNRPQFCLSHNQCSSNYWCHIGADSQTTVCCPGKAEGLAICLQPKTAGIGTAKLQRWYYDTNTRQCLPFTYHGTMGNQNNFLSKQGCELTCSAYVNVCPHGEPLLEETTNQPRRCTFGADSCGPKYWCHLGLVANEYQCCAGPETNPAACKMTYSAGVSGAPAPPATRWYYDVATLTCKTFQYNGRKGNQNNFLTESDCADTCTVFVNPCNQPISLPPLSCSHSQSCPTGSYCHYGLSPETTICCPTDGNRCEQPMDRGTGVGSLQRWYYNRQQQICEIFIYSGMHGNANNFLRKEDCETACRKLDSFGHSGEPFIISNGTYQICEVSSSLQRSNCPSGYWCNPGSKSLTKVCCPGAVNDPCNLPVITGEGDEELERYYYDATTKTCQTACQSQCHLLENPCIGQPATTAAGQVLFCSAINKEVCPVNFWCHVGATPETTVCCPGATNPCSVPLSPGSGNAGLSRWYYSTDDRECLPFQYNGIRGNQNNFISQTECSRICPVFENPCIGKLARDKKGRPRTCNPLKSSPCTTGYFCLTGNSKNRQSYCCQKRTDDPCSVYMSEGEGEDELQRWYFNTEQSVCIPFVYRGRKAIIKRKRTAKSEIIPNSESLKGVKSLKCESLEDAKL